MTADQRDIGMFRRASDEVAAAFDSIDILFANAGIEVLRPLVAIDPKLVGGQSAKISPVVPALGE